MREVASFEELSSSIGAEFYAYWERKRGTRRMPSRADIDPAEIKRILPNITLAKIERDGRVRFTLVATQRVRAPITPTTISMIWISAVTWAPIGTRSIARCVGSGGPYSAS